MSEAIAVVDDEEILCEILTEVLTDEGYTACAFTSATACLKAMATGFRPRLVFVDLRMGGLSGAEFVRRVRTEHPKADIHIYVVSGSMLDGDYPPRNSIQGVVGKPFNLDQILRIAKERLGDPRGGETGADAEPVAREDGLAAGPAPAG